MPIGRSENAEPQSKMPNARGETASTESTMPSARGEMASQALHQIRLIVNSKFEKRVAAGETEFRTYI